MKKLSAGRRCRTCRNLTKRSTMRSLRRQMQLPFRKHQRRFDLRSGVLGAAGGAVATYFVDPHHGRARRHMVRDRCLGSARHAGRRARHRLNVQTAFALGHARGLAHRLRHAPARELDDATLAHKVESIVFRDHRFPKGQINVNAERGAVYLRGELDSPELIEDLVSAVRAVPGVHGVENLLHLGESSPPAAR